MNLNGTISKIKVLKYDQRNILVRFSILSNDTTINCLVSDKQLADKIMTFRDNDISICGHGYFNNRKQFILKKMFIQNSEWRLWA